MSRRSAASLTVAPVDGRRPKLKPPTSLSAAERAIFSAIVDACDSAHFRPSDEPLLCRYCEAVALAEQAAQELRLGAVLDGKVSPWLIVQEKAVRAQVALSMRLRLSPQSRTDPKTIARNLPYQGPRPWEIGR